MPKKRKHYDNSAFETDYQEAVRRQSCLNYALAAPAPYLKWFDNYNVFTRSTLGAFDLCEYDRAYDIERVAKALSVPGLWFPVFFTFSVCSLDLNLLTLGWICWQTIAKRYESRTFSKVPRL